LKTSDFDYFLPPERIAQTPVEPRHSSRLMVLRRDREPLEHSTFWNLGDYLNPGDLLVINETRVIPARLYAHKETGGKVELLLLQRIDDRTWEVLVGGKGLVTGKRLCIDNGPGAEITTVLEGSRRLVCFDRPVEGYLEQIGQMPLPPYIHTPLADPQRYQTVYARRPGSAAAPTAGLHFTPELMQKLIDQGVRFASVTLQVGLDTFAPVTEDNPLEHKIHTEWCEVTRETSDSVNATHQAGGRVIAVGTTSVRTLESAVYSGSLGELVTPISGPTSLFILPGYRFQVVDAMITNFHLPRSTLLMLVSAFAGRQKILAAYQEAMRLNYRFYSFGDAMLIL
jgi:S-adenosylmethionine:tRNA ribosyltransferase-isomerase